MQPGKRGPVCTNIAQGTSMAATIVDLLKVYKKFFPSLFVTVVPEVGRAFAYCTNLCILVQSSNGKTVTAPSKTTLQWKLPCVTQNGSLLIINCGIVTYSAGKCIASA